MPSLIKLACPNCGYNLAEENLHSNVLQCPRCNSYTYYESGMYNVNVFFGLLRNRVYNLDGLRSTIIERYVQQGSLKAIRNIKYLHAERILVPVREIDHNGHTKAVSLLEQNLETMDENADVRQLLKNCTDLSSLFSMQYLQPLRLGAVRDETDRSGYITRTTILPVGRTKMSIDTAYGLQPGGLLRILYVPVFRLAFNDKDAKKLCFANTELTGLPITAAPLHTGFDFEDAIPIAAVFSVSIAIALDVIGFAKGTITSDGGDFVSRTILLVIVIAVFTAIVALLVFVASMVVLFFCSKLSVSLNVIASAKRWFIRRTLSRKFRLNEKIK